MKGFTHRMLVGVMVSLCAAGAAGAANQGGIGCGEPVTGTLDGANPTDTWTFHARARQRVLIDVGGTAGDLVPTAALLTAKDETLEDAGEYLEHQFTKDGDYKIVVAGAGSGDYALRYVNLQDCVRASLACGDPCRAAIDSAVDMDIYQFEGVLGQRILLQLDGRAGFVPWLTLYPPDGGSWEAETSGLLEHPLLQSGTYTVVVYGDRDTTGPYDLSYVGGRHADHGHETIACTQSGALDWPADMHVYQFNVPAGQEVDVDLAPGSNPAVCMHLFFLDYDLPLYPKEKVNVGSSILPYTVTVPGTHTLVLYAQDSSQRGPFGYTITLTGQRTITIEASRGGSVTPLPDAYAYSCGENVTATAQASTNYQFLNWTVAPADGGQARESNEPDLAFVVDGDYTLTAHFALVKRTLDLSCNEGGAVTPGPGRHDYEHGTPVKVTAKPAPNYEFQAWTGTAVQLGKVETGSEPNAITVIVDGNYTLQAHFALARYTLDLSSTEGGSVTPSAGLYDYDYGTAVEVTVTPAANYEFQGWAGTAVDAGKVKAGSGPHTFIVTVDGDYTLQARFVLVNRVLDLSCTEGGSVVPAAGRHEYAHGTPVEITVVPEDDHAFQRWTGTAVDAGKVTPGGTANTFTVIVDGNYTLQAHFGPAQRTLDLSGTEGGSVTPLAGRHTYEHGTAVEVTVAPGANYEFQGWTGTAVDAGKIKAGSGPHTFVVTVDSDYTLQARFVLVSRVLDLSGTQGGSVTPSAGRHEYAHGTAVAITVVPGANYEFQGWTGTAVDAGKVTPGSGPQTFTVTVDGDYTLRANFVLIKRVLDISATTGGFVTPAPGRYEYDHGTAVEITATSVGSYELRGWTGTAVEAGKAEVRGNVIKITLDDNYTLQASFMPRRVPPQVRTPGVESITPESVSLQGELIADGNDICTCWFRYGTESLELETPKVSGKRGGESFRQTIAGLSCGTTYYYQAWAENSLHRAGGEVRRFTPVLLTVSSDEGGIVSKPGLGVFFDHDPNTLAVRAEPVDPGYYFWYWTGSAVDAGKIPGDGATTPDVNVHVDANDTLRAMFLRAIPAWDDDVDRPGRRGVSFSTSQLWDFDGHTGATTGVPADLYEVAGAAPNGRPPLPGTALAVAGQSWPAGQQWWPTDPFASTGRQGLLAATGLHARINVWQSHATATSVWVQVVWHPCENAPADLFPPEAPAKLALLDQDPPRLQFRLLAEEYLLYGWRRSTYAWDVAPSPTQVCFTLGGRVAIDSLIVDTYSETPVAGDEIHVDDNASYDPGPGDIASSDPLEDGTPQRPFDSIQEAVNAAPQGATIIVHEGRYREAIHLPGKTLTITAGWLVYSNVGAPSILEAVGPGPAVHLSGREGANCVLSGLTITGGTDPGGAAILCQGGGPTISHCILCGNVVPAEGGALVVCQDSRAQFINCTITDNSVGPHGAVFSLTDSAVDLRNSIVWNNGGPVLDVASGPGPALTYCDIEGGWPGLGNLNVDPGFACRGYWHNAGTPGNPADDFWVAGDYHLQSLQGRFVATQKVWLKDTMSSPCLDASSPSAIWNQEPKPQGSRINMGAYGGTTQASKSSGL